jgi:serine/threonine protein kinase
MDRQHQTGDVIGDRYRIVAPLGQGGMGTTYEAEDLTNYQRVAIKVLSLRQIKEWKVLELFEREARILANLEHPAIPKYLDYFPIDFPNNRRFYLVRELVRGESLADLVEKAWQANELEVKQIAVQVLDILNYLHQLTPPVIHRDIKPQNIIRRPDGQVFLVDFGAVQEVYRNTLTRGGTFIGTLGYVPQEQFCGNVQPASDLYSLGATLLFLLTKRSPDELPVRRMKIDFRRYVQVLPEFGDWLEKMLEPAIEDRFQSAKDALEALQNHKKVTPSVPLPTQSKPEKPERFRVSKTTRHLVVEMSPLGGGALGVIFILLAISILFMLLPETHVVFKLGLIASLWLMMGSPFVCRYLWEIKGRIRLEIDPQNFRVQWIMWGIPFGHVQAKTAYIERIEQIDSKTKDSTTSCLIVWEGVNRHTFDLGSRKEEQWLADEATDFLLQLRKRSYK